MGTMGELQMTEYSDLVAKRRLYIASEDWGNKIAQHYVCKGNVGDLGYGMGYFVYYNNGAVHKLSEGKIDIVQKSNSIEEVMDDYGRAHAGK
jgi:hypothetical protein